MPIEEEQEARDRRMKFIHEWRNENQDTLVMLGLQAFPEAMLAAIKYGETHEAEKDPFPGWPPLTDEEVGAMVCLSQWCEKDLPGHGEILLRLLKRPTKAMGRVGDG